MVAQGRTHYPRWMAIPNPIVVNLAVIAIYFALPVVGNVLLPAAFSVANFVLFTLSTALLLGRPGLVATLVGRSRRSTFFDLLQREYRRAASLRDQDARRHGGQVRVVAPRR